MPFHHFLSCRCPLPPMSDAHASLFSCLMTPPTFLSIHMLSPFCPGATDWKELLATEAQKWHLYLKTYFLYRETRTGKQNTIVIRRADPEKCSSEAHVFCKSVTELLGDRLLTVVEVSETFASEGSMRGWEKHLNTCSSQMKQMAASLVSVCASPTLLPSWSSERRGIPPDAARHRSCAALWKCVRLKDESRQVWGVHWFSWDTFFFLLSSHPFLFFLCKS